MLTSKSNELIKFVKSLRDKKNRDETGMFVIEGLKFVKDALSSGFAPAHLICTSKNFGDFSQYRPVEVSAELFDYISETKTPQGVLGVFNKPAYEENDIFTSDRILYLENVQNSDNVGALIRSAVCAGYKAVLSDLTTADCFSDKAVRASAGAVFHSIQHRCGADIIDVLKAKGYTILGTHLRGDTEAPVRFDKTALIIGNEGSGMSDELADKCDYLVKIPIYGPCESLNAVSAGTLLMYKTIGY